MIVVVAACEIAGAPSLAPGAPRGPAAAHAEELDAAPADFPALRSPARLPRADVLSAEVRARGRAQVSVRLRVCVNARGAVVELRLDERSGLAGLDAAIAADVAGWRYEPFRAPADVRVCEPVTIRYLL
jgi:hypothetical protein